MVNIRMMKGRMWVYVAVVLVMLTGCSKSDDEPGQSSSPEPAATDQQGSSAQNDQHLKTMVYTGTLPCHEDNCTGIEAEVSLRLTEDGQPSGFSIKENYKNGSSTMRVVNSLGQWSQITGSANNQEAEVYQVGTLVNHRLLFEVVDKNTLRMLGDDLKPYDASHHYDLTLKQ